MVYIKQILSVFFALLIITPAFSQNRDVEKGKEILAKAMAAKEASKKNDLLKSAIEHFTKGGLKKEMNAIIGDAFLENKDYTGASNYYGRCDKEGKKEGLRKVAEAYIDAAFEDEKTEAKMIANAQKFFTKAAADKEGAIMIGDRYYEKGMSFYPKAVDFYVQGDAKSKLEKVAKDYEGKGGDNIVLAAETYKKLNTPEAFHKAGEIYFSRKEYGRAGDAYLSGNDLEGIKKYANYLYKQQRDAEADNLYLKLADNYSAKNNDKELNLLGNTCVYLNKFSLATKIFEKAGNMAQSNKYLAFDKMLDLDYDSAQALLSANGEPALAKAITDNMKVLKPLKDVAFNFDALVKNKPFVASIVDSLSGESNSVKSETKVLDTYYKTAKNQIVDNLVVLSSNAAKITNSQLKQLILLRFSRYGAVRNVLDNNFNMRIQKAMIQIKDVYM